MSNRRRSVCLLSLVIAVPSLADSVLRLQTTEFNQGEPIVGTVQISTAGANTRLEIISVSSAEAGGMIFNGENNEMIILDHLQAQFMVIDQERMDAMAAQVSEDMTQENAVAATVRSPDTINALGSHGVVADIECKTYEVVRDGRKVRELCVSDWDDIDGGQETAEALRDVTEFFESMRQAYSSTGAMEVFDRQQELFGHMAELDGYPVLYRDFSPGGSLLRQTILTSARQEELSPEFFEPPKGYVLQELPQGMN